MKHTHFLSHLDTPIGRLALLADRSGSLIAVGFTDGHERMQRLLRGHQDSEAPLIVNEDPSGLRDVFSRYFGGELTALDSLTVRLHGTEFQTLVWETLRQIPCGETWSYGRLAKRIERPSAVRAVGLANGANPVSLVLPCHRVIGADGSLTGYGGGLDRKRWLLAHEGAARATEQLTLI